MKVSAAIFDHANDIPPGTVDCLRGYYLRGIYPSGFLHAVLNNDLTMTCLIADDANRVALVDIVKFLHWQMPVGSWGHPDAVTDWIRKFREAA